MGLGYRFEFRVYGLGLETDDPYERPHTPFVYKRRNGVTKLKVLLTISN